MFFNKLASCPVPKGPFINYVMHLGGEGVCNFVTICDGGGRGGWLHCYITLRYM